MSFPEEIEDEAAGWLIRREEPGFGAADEAELQIWLDASFNHKAAYWRLEHAWRAADRISSMGPDAAQVLGDDAVSGDDAAVLDSAVDRSRRFAGWRPLALAASLMLAILVGWNAFQAYGPAPATLEQLGPIAIAPEPPQRAQLVETGTAGKKMVNLSDGSRIELAASTSIHADIRETSRHIWLDDGEAYFDVKHAADVPFVIHAGSRVVTVLGTRFSVRRDGDQVRVNVVEGRVRVDDVALPGAPPVPVRSTIISAGDLAVARGASTIVEPASPEKVADQLGWRKGVLNFDRMTLGQAAAEFNRYNDRKLVVDPAVAGTRIGGTFKTNNIEDFAELLREAYGLRVEESVGQIKISD
ncbi:FecR family protein [Sphingopyxis fribergensis]